MTEQNDDSHKLYKDYTTNFEAVSEDFVEASDEDDDEVYDVEDCELFAILGGHNFKIIVDFLAQHSVVLDNLDFFESGKKILVNDKDQQFGVTMTVFGLNKVSQSGNILIVNQMIGNRVGFHNGDKLRFLKDLIQEVTSCEFVVANNVDRKVATKPNIQAAMRRLCPKILVKNINKVTQLNQATGKQAYTDSCKVQIGVGCFASPLSRSR